MPFNVEAARASGVSEEDIQAILASEQPTQQTQPTTKFDVEAARENNVSEEDIQAILASEQPTQQTQQQRDLENESDALRGFDQYGNQIGGLYGAGKILLGKLFGSDDMIVSGLGYMNRSDEAVQARGVRDTDTFVNEIGRASCRERV